MRRAIRISNAPNLKEDLAINFIIPRNAGSSFEVLITFPEDIIDEEFSGQSQQVLGGEESYNEGSYRQNEGQQYKTRQITLSNRSAPVSPGKDSSLATYGMLATTRTVVPLSQSSLAYTRSGATPSITNNLAPSPITILSPQPKSSAGEEEEGTEEEQMAEEEAGEEEAGEEEEQSFQKPTTKVATKTSKPVPMVGGSISEKALMPEEFGISRNSNKTGMIKSKMRIPSSMPKTSSKSPGKPRQTFQNETGITTAVKSTNLNDAPMIPYEPSYKCQPAYDVHGNATGECVIPPKQNKQGAFYVGGQTRFSK